MQKYKYEFLRSKDLFELMEDVNDYSEKGWRLISFVISNSNYFNAILELPVEEQTAEEHIAQWKPVDCGAKDFAWDYTCTNCNHIISYPTKYCPDCGAKMEDYKK